MAWLISLCFVCSEVRVHSAGTVLSSLGAGVGSPRLSSVAVRSDLDTHSVGLTLKQKNQIWDYEYVTRIGQQNRKGGYLVIINLLRDFCQFSIKTYVVGTH